MAITEHRGGSVILTTMLISLFLIIMPIPPWAEHFRPPWAGLVLIYWCLATPQRVGVLSGWLLGLTLDALVGTTLGENALILAVIAYLFQQFHNRFRVFPLWQQAVVLIPVFLLGRIISFWIRSSFGQMPPTLLFWASPFIGALIWPWVYILLRDVRRRFSVA